jgi:hypothetical protein
MTFKIKSWNHRADISAQTYLKLSQKGKTNVTECILENFAVIPQKTQLFLDIWFKFYGELNFSPKQHRFFHYDDMEVKNQI